MTNDPTSRRERIHNQTIREIKRIALRQMAESGAGSISMNAIAREMGMTGPALFRYVPNRDALMTELVVESFEDLAEAFESDMGENDTRLTERILRDQAASLRRWALANPQRYLFIFGTPVPGFHPPAERTMPAAWRLLSATITPLVPIAPQSWPPPTDPFERELEQWAADNEIPAIPGRMLLQAFQSWTRLHGILSLELAGHFSPQLPGPTGLYEAEVDGLIELIRDYLPDQR